MLRARRGTDRRGATFQLSSRSVDAIEFLALSAWREKEALTLRWDDLNLHDGTATLEDTKEGSPCVCSVRTRSPCSSVSRGSKAHRTSFRALVRVSPCRESTKAWRRLRADARLEDFRLNDLRHSFASMVVNEGYSDYIAGKLLGHRRQSNVTQRYAHLSDKTMRNAADHTSSLLAGLLNAPAN